MQQATLFSDISESASERSLPVLGEQKDIRYYQTPVRHVLNSPEATGMGFWSINPYVGCAFGCAYCYARFTHRYVSERAVASASTDDAFASDVQALPPWLAFERRILVKRDAPARLRRELVAGAGADATIVIGTATDPYQPAERSFRVTRGVLEVLTEAAGVSLVIITKSPLVTRDIDLLQAIARRSRLTIHVSLITLDRGLARRIEPRSPTPESRLRAIERLTAAGIDVGVNVMPVLPGITDDPHALEALVRRIADTGASHVHAGALRLRREAFERYLPVVERDFPALADRYRRTYGRSSEAGDRYRDGLHRVMTRLCRAAGLRFGVYDDRPERGASTRRARTALPETQQRELHDALASAHETRRSDAVASAANGGEREIERAIAHEPASAHEPRSTDAVADPPPLTLAMPPQLALPFASSAVLATRGGPMSGG